MVEKIAVIGLGYVGLPVAVGHGAGARCAWSASTSTAVASRPCATAPTPRANSGPTSLRPSTLRYTADPADLAGCTCFILTVPTPIDANRQPDLRAVRRACGSVGAALRPGGIVVVESTVYPGVTEEVCGPLLRRSSRAWPRGAISTLGYSPERINPGDREHRLENILKVVAGRGRSDAARGWQPSTARWSRPGCTGRPRSRSPRPPR